MFWRKKKPSNQSILPAGIEAQIGSLAAKLDSEPKHKKPSLFLKALWIFRKKMRGYSSSYDRWAIDERVRWVASSARWQFAFSLVGLLVSILATRYVFIRPGMSVLWLIASLLPSAIAYISDHDRLSFWMSTHLGASGFLLILLRPPIPWYGPVIQLAFPVTHLLICVRKEQRVLQQEENELAAREAANPIDRLLKLIDKHRQKIIGTGSEFGSHLAKLEAKLSQVRQDRSHWQRRVSQEKDSKLFAARLSEAQTMEERLVASCDTLYRKKQEIVAGLDDLQARVPIINAEIDDWRQDQAHQALMDEAGVLADETEMVVRRAIQSFSADIQQIAGQIEGLRVQIAGGTCEPKLIVATEEKVEEVLDDTETIVAAPKKMANAAIS